MKLAILLLSAATALGLTSVGSCYESRTITCNVTKADCTGYWYDPGFISGYSGCCHCLGSCNSTLERADPGECSIYPDGVTSIGGCYNTVTREVTCNVAQATCLNSTGYWNAPGYISSYTDCCQCLGSCNQTLAPNQPYPIGTCYYPDGPCETKVTGNVNCVSLDNGNIKDAVFEWFASARPGGNRAAVIEKYGRIRDWDVSRVTDFTSVFEDYSSDMADTDVSGWVTSAATSMESMFQDTDFNGDLSKWDVSNVRNMRLMFAIAKFNGNISAWDVSNVNDTSTMFYRGPFNGEGLDAWDVSSVKNMGGMFYASAFNQPLPSWDTRKCTAFDNMFDDDDFNQDLSMWCVESQTTEPSSFGNKGADPVWGTCPCPVAGRTCSPSAVPSAAPSAAPTLKPTLRATMAPTKATGGGGQTPAAPTPAAPTPAAPTPAAPTPTSGATVAAATAVVATVAAVLCVFFAMAF